MLNKVVIFGVGLIGGSFARSLRKAGAVRQIVGVGRSAASTARALELGIVDAVGVIAPAGATQASFAAQGAASSGAAATAATAAAGQAGRTGQPWQTGLAGGEGAAAGAPLSLAEALAGADLVLLAAPVAQTEAILAAIAPHLKAGTVVTDAGSTKSDVVAAARRTLGAKVAQFVPGHPIAGRETNGPDAAIDDLYVGKKVVITALPENAAADVERVAQAWRACHAIIHRLTPEEHDKVFAAVSHLPHLLAYALVDDIAKKPHADLLFQYAASGFRDFTRIAGSSPEMWRDISLANQSSLLTELDAYMAQLTVLRAQLAAGDGAALEKVYSNAQHARHKWITAIETAEAPASQDKAD